MYPYKKRYKILGGPGCGKTTKILDILAEYIKGGINLDQVLLIGFAKATVQELQNRVIKKGLLTEKQACLLYTSPSPRDGLLSRMPSSA